MRPGNPSPALPPARREHKSAAVKPPKSLPVALADSFIYPLRGMGWALILFGAIALGGVSVFSRFFFGGGIVLMGTVMYILAYFLQAVASSAGGSDDPPDWPDLRDAWNDILCPSLVFGIELLAAFVPLLVINLLLYEATPGHQTISVVRGVLTGFSNIDEPLASILRFAALALGLVPLPMAIVAGALSDSLSGLNPLRTFPAIFRIGLPYLPVLLLLTGTIAGGATAMVMVSHVAVFGGVLVTVATLYVGMVMARILGLTYHRYAKRIGWFD
jgi:hypothetical protein